MGKFTLPHRHFRRHLRTYCRFASTDRILPLDRSGDEAYHHMGAVFGGLPAGIIALLVILDSVSSSDTRCRVRATSSVGDWLALAMLIIVIVTGILATSANAVNHSGFDYRTTINPWLRGSLVFQPDPALMQTVPMNFKVHILLTFVLYCVFPFTRLCSHAEHAN